MRNHRQGTTKRRVLHTRSKKILREENRPLPFGNAIPRTQRRTGERKGKFDKTVRQLVPVFSRRERRANELVRRSYGKTEPPETKGENNRAHGTKRRKRQPQPRDGTVATPGCWHKRLVVSKLTCRSTRRRCHCTANIATKMVTPYPRAKVAAFPPTVAIITLRSGMYFPFTLSLS